MGVICPTEQVTVDVQGRSNLPELKAAVVLALLSDQ
jgi:hypothetical protein